MEKIMFRKWIEKQNRNLAGYNWSNSVADFIQFFKKKTWRLQKFLNYCIRRLRGISNKNTTNRILQENR